MINTLLTDKERYLHYVVKLRKLQQEKLEKTNKGEKLSKSQTERLERNVVKLEKAASSYKVILRKLRFPLLIFRNEEDRLCILVQIKLKL